MDWWMWVIVALAAYVAVLFALAWITGFFFGSKAASRALAVYGAPITVVVWLSERFIRVITWPWTYRNNRLMGEVFHLYPADDDYNPQDLQPRVGQVLSSLARDMQDAFDAEEEYRKQRPRDKEMLAIAKADAAWAKKRFWSAHALARRNGFVVYKTYDEHIPMDW